MSGRSNPKAIRRARLKRDNPMDVKLVRHVKVRGDTNPHNARNKDYFMWRRRGQIYRELTGPGP